MSGSGAALAVGGLSFLSDLASNDQTVSIGDFVFDKWEIPEHIEWGGAQRLTVHKLVGGVRVIDVMGEDHSDISWSGIFLSPDASERADQLDKMRIAGEVVELIFAGRYYLVVISNFRADQRKGWHVPYTITCSVMNDQSAVGMDPPSILSQLLSDVQAVALLIGDVTALVAGAMAILASIVGSSDTIESGSDQQRAIAQALADTNAALQAQQVEATNRINALTAATAAADPVAAAASVDVGIANLQDAAAAAKDAALAALISGYIQRAATNLEEA